MHSDIDSGSNDTNSDFEFPFGNGTKIYMHNETFGELMSTIFDTQADIIGISSAIAEYLLWARRYPAKFNMSTTWDVIDERLRELTQLASTRHWLALKHAMSSVDSADVLHDRLTQLETDLIRKTIRRTDVFRENYDVRLSLSGQRESTR
jgi:hypothetical protein